MVGQSGVHCPGPALQLSKTYHFSDVWGCEVANGPTSQAKRVCKTQALMH